MEEACKEILNSIDKDHTHTHKIANRELVLCLRKTLQRTARFGLDCTSRPVSTTKTMPR